MGYSRKSEQAGRPGGIAGVPLHNGEVANGSRVVGNFSQPAELGDDQLLAFPEGIDRLCVRGRSMRESVHLARLEEGIEGQSFRIGIGCGRKSWSRAREHEQGG